MNNIFKEIGHFLRDRFDLISDKATDAVILADVRKNVDFRGTNLWMLVFAVFIASIGLNVDSTAVVIGAMLISPIMGPIIGVGTGIGVNDFRLFKRGLKNLIIAFVIGIITSSLYFLITPLHEPSKEITARTMPTIWDVFIALFGGLAGMVGYTRNERTNVIPGVAIATALMPPLCTAGFGLANGRWYDMMGAMYLFFINSVFIGIGTYLVLRLMDLHKTQFEDEKREKRVRKYMIIISIITIAPSIYLAYRLVDRTVFENNATRYVQRVFRFDKTQVIDKNFKIRRGIKEIDLVLIGEELTPMQQDSLHRQMPRFGLDTNVVLKIRQGLNARNQIDMAQIKASILEDVYAANNGARRSKAPEEGIPAVPDLRQEMGVLFPAVDYFTLGRMALLPVDAGSAPDTAYVFGVKYKQNVSAAEQAKMRRWLNKRLAGDTIVFSRFQ